jgi:hypothetical protein
MCDFFHYICIIKFVSPLNLCLCAYRAISYLQFVTVHGAAYVVDYIHKLSLLSYVIARVSVCLCFIASVSGNRLIMHHKYFPGG